MERKVKAKPTVVRDSAATTTREPGEPGQAAKQLSVELSHTLTQW